MSERLAELRIADLLHVALEAGASDIHASPNQPPVLRVDGRLRELPGRALTAEELRAFARTFFSPALFERIESGEDATVTRATERGSAVRVHGFRTHNGTALSLRLLNAAVPTLPSLRLPAVVTKMAERQHGLVIFAGPTGSGKTTSLAALIEHINSTMARRIITIEDPIEYRHVSKLSSIVQREVGRDALSYASAVNGLLRADPDVILVGEMRDHAAMRAVLTAAETGHLVFTTLHTGDAASTIDRIIDAFAAEERAQIRSQLALVLAGVVCQRLVPRPGERGRTVAAEVLIATDAVRATVRDGRTHQLRNSILTGRSVGMQTLESHLAELIALREVDPQAALLLCSRPEELNVERAIA